MVRAHLSSRSSGRTSSLTAAQTPARDILGGLADQPDWQELGLCQQTDPEIFFPEKGESSQPAKDICKRCPVREECLQWALDNDERFGVLGGTSPQERKKMRNDPKRPTAHDRAQAILDAGEKECPRCAETKPLDQFSRDSKSLTGHGGTCKSCRYALETRGTALKRQGFNPPPRAESPQAIQARRRLAGDAA